MRLSNSLPSGRDRNVCRPVLSVKTKRQFSSCCVVFNLTPSIYNLHEPNHVSVHAIDKNYITAHIFDKNYATAHILDPTKVTTYILDTNYVTTHILDLSYATVHK